MKNAYLRYSFFAFNTILKKKSSILLPIIAVAISFFVGIVFKFAVPSNYQELAVFFYTFIAIIMTAVYSSIKALNLFKDLEQEGIEIITLSKPISRKQLILGKLICLSYFGLIWSTALLISGFLYFYASFNFVNVLINSLTLFFVSLSAYFIIGLFVSLLSFKLSQKIAMTLPLIAFIPLSSIGILLASNQTTNINKASSFINRSYEYHHSGNEVNTEPYFINNNKDELLLIPNGSDNKDFDQEQKEYLQTVINYTNRSLTSWQTYSWISIPYQFINIFNFNSKNISITNANNSTDLEKYVYYNDLDNISYTYKLDKKPNQVKYKVADDSNQKFSEKYIVPGLLKSHSKFSDFTQTVNYDLIYAIDGAENDDSKFFEDENEFSNQRSSLVGRIKWNVIKQALQDKKFNLIASDFVNQNLKEFLNDKSNTSEQLNKKHKQLMSKISEYVTNEDSEINNYENHNIKLFDKRSITDGEIDGVVQIKIYKAIAILNYIYFNYQDSQLFKIMIKNPNNEYFGDAQINLELDGRNYRLGGFKNFSEKVVQEEKDGVKKTLFRFDLQESKSNFLFSSADNLYSITRNRQIVNKYVIALLWLVIIGAEFALTFKIYQRKEYK
ncbi:ABC transporter permease [Mycoplasma yeatsii]|uniref:ABC transporter permease n=1 Tax=Mycoplasma yeatsii TaxID=51365 RepID=UPI0005B23A00|nr:ABC transporter permease [Mycoplasma yeatsii]AJM71528.1 ABC transporter permease protein [Mycoplasma yeatsii GM274B]